MSESKPKSDSKKWIFRIIIIIVAIIVIIVGIFQIQSGLDQIGWTYNSISVNDKYLFNSLKKFVY